MEILYPKQTNQHTFTTIQLISLISFTIIMTITFITLTYILLSTSSSPSTSTHMSSTHITNYLHSIDVDVDFSDSNNPQPSQPLLPDTKYTTTHKETPYSFFLPLISYLGRLTFSYTHEKIEAIKNAQKILFQEMNNLQNEKCQKLVYSTSPDYFGNKTKEGKLHRNYWRNKIVQNVFKVLDYR